MKKIICLLTFTFASLITQSQNFKNLKIVNKEDKVFLIENATLGSDGKTLNYIDENNQTKMFLLSEINKIEQKRGSFWLSGLIGGLAGSILVNFITNDGENEWYTGAGPSILAGTGVATIVGALTPRYKEIKITDNTKLTVSLNSLKLSF